MDSYIVRIIRRKDANHGIYLALDGVGENAEDNIRRPFHKADQLWFILGDFTSLKQ